MGKETLQPYLKVSKEKHGTAGPQKKKTKVDLREEDRALLIKGDFFLTSRLRRLSRILMSLFSKDIH